MPRRRDELKAAIRWNSLFYRPRLRTHVKFAALPWNGVEFISTWFDSTELARPDGISRCASGELLPEFPRTSSAPARVAEGLTTYSLLPAMGDPSRVCAAPTPCRSPLRQLRRMLRSFRQSPTDETDRPVRAHSKAVGLFTAAQD
jgi:hypothetical protein